MANGSIMIQTLSDNGERAGIQKRESFNHVSAAPSGTNRETDNVRAGNLKRRCRRE